METGSIVLSTRKHVPRGEGGIYECSNCGARKSCGEGKPCGPCAECRASGIRWTQVISADATEAEPEHHAPIAPDPVPERHAPVEPVPEHQVSASPARQPSDGPRLLTPEDMRRGDTVGRRVSKLDSGWATDEVERDFKVEEIVD